MTMPTLLRSPRMNLDDLLVRLLDSLLGLPAFDQHAVHHAGENIVGNHRRRPNSRARIGELASTLSMPRQCWNTGRFQKSESYMPFGGPPAPVPFLDHHPQVLRGHPVFGEPSSDLSIGILFEQDPLGQVCSSTTPAGPAGTGNKPVVLYRSLSESARWA